MLVLGELARKQVFSPNVWAIYQKSKHFRPMFGRQGKKASVFAQCLGDKARKQAFSPNVWAMYQKSKHFRPMFGRQDKKINAFAKFMGKKSTNLLHKSKFVDTNPNLKSKICIYSICNPLHHIILHISILHCLIFRRITHESQFNNRHRHFAPVNPCHSVI